MGERLPHGRGQPHKPRMRCSIPFEIPIWLTEKVTAKRGKKRDAGDTKHKLPKGDELTIHRLASEVSGIAQKYARIGPREFVPFTEDELKIEIVVVETFCRVSRYFSGLRYSRKRAGSFLQDFGEDTGYEGNHYVRFVTGNI